MPLRSLVLGLSLLLSGTALAAQPARFERISDGVSQGRPVPVYYVIPVSFSAKE